MPGLAGSSSKILRKSRLTWPDPAASAYRGLLHRLDNWFAESSARHPGIVPCRSGCTACCHGPFDISVADALLVRNAVARLPVSERLEVERRADLQLQRMRELEPGWNLQDGVRGLAEEAFDKLTESMAAEACPLLNDEGGCRIYEDRPLVCRMMGLGIVTPAGRVVENACPIASQFPDYAALPLQPFDLEALEELETASLEAASTELFGRPDRAGFETTIAGAIVELGE